MQLVDIALSSNVHVQKLTQGKPVIVFRYCGTMPSWMTIMCERLTSLDEEQFITRIQQQLQFIPERAETQVGTLCVHVRSKTDCGFEIVKEIVIPTVICIVVITIFVVSDIATYSKF